MVFLLIIIFICCLKVGKSCNEYFDLEGCFDERYIYLDLMVDCIEATFIRPDGKLQLDSSKNKHTFYKNINEIYDEYCKYHKMSRLRQFSDELSEILTKNIDILGQIKLNTLEKMEKIEFYFDNKITKKKIKEIELNIEKINYKRFTELTIQKSFFLILLLFLG